jgi:hypothetical protein
MLDVHVQRQAIVRGRFQAISMIESDSKSRQIVGHESQPSASASASTSRQQQHAVEGYALPEEQFAYGEDTGYHGAAGQIGRRSMEGRM